ncbi:cytoplasmic tRNA 2-thiolation protein 2 isoform X2 [Prorops nasuta]
MCKKCKTGDIQVWLRGTDTYCKDCFLANASHKFKSALGKSKIIRKDDIILIDYSGNKSSTALLHLMQAAMCESSKKKLIFKPIVLFIDEGCAQNKPLAERKLVINKILTEVKNFGFTGYVTSLDQAINKSICIEDINISKLLENNNDWYKIMDKLLDVTSKNDFLYQLRMKLLINVASKLKCNKIFTTESTADLAMKILCNMSLGRGSNVMSDIVFSDVMKSNIVLIQPMKDFSTTEINNYLNCYKIHPILEDANSHKIVDGNSIQAVTKQFINQLDSKLNGTVSTIFHTGDKLRIEKNLEQNIETCIFCNLCLDTSLSEDISAVDAIAFSRLISLNGLNTSHNNIDIKSSTTNKYQECNNCNCTESKHNKICLVGFHKNLCYSCRSIFSKLNTDEVIPNFLMIQ